MSLEAIIDGARFGRLHVRILLIGLLVMFLEGVDIQIIGFAAPTIIREWGIPAAAFGAVFSAGLLGATIGAAVLGPLGDRFGRKPLIITNIIVFAIGTIATPLATSLETLIAIRFVASLGLGGVIPNLLALVAEYAPQRIRGTIVATVATGQLAGGMVGGLVSGWAIATHGWPIIFHVAGILSLLLAPLVLWMMPESLRYLAQHPRNADRVTAGLRALMPDDPDAVPDMKSGEQTYPPSVAALFAPGLRAATLLLSLAIASNLFMTAFAIYWLPTLLEKLGMALPTAIFAVSLMNGGGILGGVVLARLMDGISPLKLLAGAYVSGGAAIGMVGFVAPDTVAVMVTAFLAGFFGLGAYAGINMVAASIYPTSLRSAGIGWAIACGKIGSIFGPLAATAGLSAGMPLPQVFLISACGGVIAAVALLFLQKVRSL